MMSRLAIAGVMVAVMTGCHSYYPYCNSCSSYSNMQPSQVYAQPSTVVPYQPPTGAPANGGTTFQPPVNSTQPPPGNGNKTVPEYDLDPANETQENFNIEPEDFLEEPSGIELEPIEDEDTFGARGTNEIEGISSETEILDEDGFAQPIPVQPASNSREIGNASPPPTAPKVASRPSPYLYDRSDDDYNGDKVPEAYEWLRGVVDFDEKNRVWRVTYNPDPTDKADKYGGTFTLSNDQGLYELNVVPDDVVLIDGRVDLQNPDREGKPTYRVESIKRLEPVKAHQPANE